MILRDQCPISESASEMAKAAEMDAHSSQNDSCGPVSFKSVFQAESWVDDDKQEDDLESLEALLLQRDEALQSAPTSTKKTQLHSTSPVASTLLKTIESTEWPLSPPEFMEYRIEQSVDPAGARGLQAHVGISDDHVRKLVHQYLSEEDNNSDDATGKADIRSRQLIEESVKRVEKQDWSYLVSYLLFDTFLLIHCRRLESKQIVIMTRKIMRMKLNAP